MIKDLLKKRLIILFISLSIFILTIFFPEMKPLSNNITITYNNETTPLYIPNKDHIASRIKVVSNNTDISSKVSEIINYLTINTPASTYLPEPFSPILPANTVLKNIKIENQILSINFNKELLKLSKENSRLAIECLVYSILEINGISGIIIYVDDNLLRTFPNTSEKISYPLTRKMGINIINKMQNIKNTTSTTSYYKATEKDYSYLIPVTTIQNTNQNKIEIVIEELKSHPHIKTNIISFLNAATELTNYEKLENEIKLSFNNYLGEETEETTYAIAMSMRDTLDISNIIIN